MQMPSLRVIRSDQIDASNPEGTHGRVRHTSFSRGFSAHLTVDSDGLAIDYPTLARRI
ncbi:putative glycolipid-binding domain-containing protein [Plantibacter sp. CFBP 8775]|nr:putative glycolipid-binding domain-containing protein [Plantibacter sp. CFBP 8775]MBD8467393.1 putative glycolipid-binding domain-containing protein [Plantibacter sp. CFBP 8798]